jgi:hypothetical protein
MLFFYAVLEFPQIKADTVVYVMEVFSGPTGERSAIQQNLKAEVRALGFSLTENIRDADYRINCSIIGSALPLMVLSLLNPMEEELTTRDLVFTNPQEAYDRFPVALQALFDGQPLRQRPVSGTSGASGPAASVNQRPASGTSGASGTAAANQRPANGASRASGTAAAASQRPANGANGEPETAADFQPDSPFAEGIQADGPLVFSAPDAWKRKWLFLNARLGVSNRYYLSETDSIPTVLTFTVDTGIEAEFHPINPLALQFGLNYALDRAEYPRSSTIRPTVHSTFVLSIPFMVKYLFDTSAATTLGVYGGGYTSFVVLGTTTPPLLGVLVGIDLAVNAGPGAVLFDLRYSADPESTDVDDKKIPSYKRMFLTFSVGYKIGFITRKAPPRP